jgi:long-chain acyl-CoA synthetase
VDRALAVVRRRVGAGAAIGPTANLELDLGLDSMERVELLTELEQEFGVRVPEDQTHQIFTLGDLIDAMRPVTGTTPDSPSRAVSPGLRPIPSADRSRPVSDESWAVLLRDLPPSTDPTLRSLLRPRPLLEPLLFAAGRIFARLLARIRATGLEHVPQAGAFLICPNHQSYVDPFFVFAVLPYRTAARVFSVGAVEYFETPLMSRVARTINCVPVDPDSNLVPAMKAGAFGLTHDKVLLLFPEGERSIDGTVKRFKKGAPILSRHMGVPVVPMAIRGAYEVWPRGRSFNWRGLLPWSRSKVRLKFGAPVQFTEGESYADAAARLQKIVDDMWHGL